MSPGQIRRILLVGGPHDGVRRTIHEGDSLVITERSGRVSVYRAGLTPECWFYKAEESALLTRRGGTDPPLAGTA